MLVIFEKLVLQCEEKFSKLTYYYVKIKKPIMFKNLLNKLATSNIKTHLTNLKNYKKIQVWSHWQQFIDILTPLVGEFSHIY